MNKAKKHHHSFLDSNKLLNRHGKAYRDKDIVNKNSKRKCSSKGTKDKSSSLDINVSPESLPLNSYSELIGCLKKKPKKYFEEMLSKNNEQIKEQLDGNLPGLSCKNEELSKETDVFGDQSSEHDTDHEDPDIVDNFGINFGSEVKSKPSSKISLIDVPNTIFNVQKSSNCKVANEIKTLNDLQQTGLDSSLLKHWMNMTKQIKSKGVMRPLSSLIYPYMAIGSDLFFAQSTFENKSQISRLLALHATDHIVKTRKYVLKNNKKLAEDSSRSDNMQDQGFTRPTVLILLPFKNMAYELVQEIIKVSLTGSKRQVSSRKRFEQEYGPDSEEKPNLSKSFSYQKTFLGNNDDFFTLGVAFAKNSVKLYTNFYNSDLIIASPLGLRNLIGADGDADRDYDFLSSIEIVGILGCDILLMQNWEHLLHTLNHLNKQPVKDHSTDFSRVKEWVLEGHGKQFRQNLVFGAWSCPEIQSLFDKECPNQRGLVMVSPSVQPGCLSDVMTPARQLFLQMRDQKEEESRVDYMTNGRYTYFVNNIIPRFISFQSVVIVVPSYYDFVRLRNHGKKEGIEMAVLSEYSPNKAITNTRRKFAEGDVKLLITTERFFFFKRYGLKNVGHVVFYGPPLYPECYTHYANMLSQPDSSCNLLYSKYDYESLERIVGEKQLRTMLTAQQRTHMIISQ